MNAVARLITLAVLLVGQLTPVFGRASSFEDKTKFLVLHFERLRCGDQAAVCTQGRCLHQVYGKEGGHYHLLKSYYVPNDY
jgi:hypothetical protein